MKFPEEFFRCGWHKAAFSFKASCVEMFFSILTEIRKTEMLFYQFNECSLMEEGGFYQGCHQRNHSGGKYVSECFNYSFPSKKVHEQRVNTEMTDRSQPNLKVHCGECQEDTGGGTKKILAAEMQNHPHRDGHVPPAPDEQT